MPIPFSGGYACGAVRYECSADPLLVMNCHCRNCQRASGSASASVLLVPKAAFTLTKGAPKYHRVTTMGRLTVSTALYIADEAFANRP